MYTGPIGRVRRILILGIVILGSSVQAQNIAINADGSPPDSSALLDLKSTTSGLLIPRMSGSQRDAIVDPTVGLIIFNSETSSFWCYAGSSWIELLQGFVTVARDADGDTKIQTEESSDEDIIRFDLGGVEYLRMDSGRIEVTNTGHSVFLGEGAGINDNLDNRQNVYIGFQSGNANVGGAANIGVGYQSLLSSTAGFWNTAIGYGTLKSNVSAHANTALGFQTLLSNTTGQLNTALGYRAMESNASGSSNTAIGTKSGFASVGDSNVFLGYYAGYNETASNKLYIHNDSTDFPLIFGDFSKDSLSVNGMLNVAGAIQINSSDATSPAAGMIRWNPSLQDFEGYNGSKWLSLTNQTAWGQISTPTAFENLSVTASDGAANDQYGESVSISGDYAITGAPNNGVGAAYIYNRSGAMWVEQDILLASDGFLGGADFGQSVSISGDYAIVGDPGYDAGLIGGRAYIFHRSGSSWTEQDILSASDLAMFGEFGKAVSIAGDYAIVGSPSHGNNDQGKAYIFHRSGSVWAQEDTLSNATGDSNANFGSSVSIAGDYAIVGARGQGTSGTAYIYHRSGVDWLPQDTLTPVDGGSGDAFGESVAITGDYAIVGAPLHNTQGNFDQGKVYIFHRSGSDWVFQDTLTASDGYSNDQFGNSVATTGQYCIVGVARDDINGNNDQGTAYVFINAGSEWHEQSFLMASDGWVGDQFGQSVSISGNYIIVGAWNHDTEGQSNQGKAYIFSKE